MFVYQSTFNMTGFKEKKYLVSALRSKGAYTTGRLPLRNHCPIIKLNNYKLILHFNSDAFTLEQSNYATKTVNAYIVYNLDICQKRPVELDYFPVMLV